MNLLLLIPKIKTWGHLVHDHLTQIVSLLCCFFWLQITPKALKWSVIQVALRVSATEVVLRVLSSFIKKSCGHTYLYCQTTSLPCKYSWRSRCRSKLAYKPLTVAHRNILVAHAFRTYSKSSAATCCIVDFPKGFLSDSSWVLLSKLLWSCYT